jgi:hypothetical protein
LKKVKKLLEMRKQVNTHDNAGIGPIHDACMLMPYATSFAVVNLLLKAGADIEDAGINWPESKTPFICAAWAGNIEVMKLLISHGARISAKDYRGYNCFDYIEPSYDTRPDLREFAAELKAKMSSDDGANFAQEPVLISDSSHNTTSDSHKTKKFDLIFDLKSKSSPRPAVSDSDMEQQYLNLPTSTSDSSERLKRKSFLDPSYFPTPSDATTTTTTETSERDTDDLTDPSSSDYGLENVGQKSRRGGSMIGQTINGL